MAAWLRRPIVPSASGAARNAAHRNENALTSPDADPRIIDITDIRRPAHRIYFPCDALGGAAPGESEAEPRLGASQEAGDTSTAYVSSLSWEELRLVHVARLNLLLIATDVDTREVLDAFRTYCHEPITTWSPGEPLVLPANAQPGTLMLEDISALTLEDQCRLHGWLGPSAGCTQVVSITSRSLLPSIRAGVFLDTLYYRLNIVCGEVARTG